LPATKDSLSNRLGITAATGRIRRQAGRGADIVGEGGNLVGVDERRAQALEMAGQQCSPAARRAPLSKFLTRWSVTYFSLM
jgi:hypothetical protein